MLVRVLGPLAVDLDDDKASTAPGSSALGGPRQRAVLAALVMNAGHSVPIAHIEDAVWPDGPPPAAAGTLQAYVSRLRGRLGANRLVRTDGGYRLLLERAELDAWLLTDAARAAEQDAGGAALPALLDALRLWRGRPLGDLGTELFAAGFVTELDNLHVRALTLAAETLLAADDAAGAVQVLTAGMSEHPYDQPLVMLYMSAQARLRRPEAALRAYRTLAERLKRDLDVAPDEQVRRIARTVAATDPAARSAVVGQERRARHPGVALPDPGTSIVGRRAELAQLRASARSHRLVTLVGPPGVGKSRLALEAAWSLAGSVTGAGHVVLEGIRDEPALLSTLAATFHVPEQPGVGLSATLVRALRARGPFLMVVDSAEHLTPEAVHALRAVVTACPALRVLATSLQPLGGPHETVLPVQPLPVPEVGGHLLDTDAGRLLLARARLAQPGFAVSAANEAALVDIVRALDGLPLALELAAGQLAVLGPTELSRRLSDRFEVLLRPGTSGRHVSMHAALSTAVDELTDDQRACLTRLGVTSGPLPMDLAERLCTGETVSATPRAALMGLARRSLLVVDDRGVSMLESVRAFCAERLRRRGQWEHVVAAHGRVLRDRLEELGEHAHSGQQGWAAGVVGALSRETSAALARLPHPQARVLASLVSPWWYRAGRLSDLAELAATFGDPGALDEPAVAICGYAALAAATDGSDWRRARALADSAVRAAEAGHDDSRLLEARLVRGDVATLTGDFANAAADLDDVIEQADQPWMVALARLRRLRVDWSRDPSSGGLASQRRAATEQAVQRSGDPQLTGYLRLTKGNRLLHMGHLHAAVAELEPARDTFEEIAHRPFHSLGTLLLAQTQTLLGRWERAEHLAVQALRRGQGTAAPFPWDPREILARRRIEDGETDTGLAMLAELEQESRDRGDETLRAVCVIDRVAAVQADSEAAAEVLGAAPPADRIPPWQRIDLLVTASEVALAGGALEESDRALDQASDAVASLGEPALVHQGRLSLAQATLSIARGDARAGAAHLAAAQRLREQSGYALSTIERRRHTAALRRCRAELGERDLARAWAG